VTSAITLRAMTVEEFQAFRARAESEYADAHVAAGEWPAERARELAASETDALLPQGAQTPKMLLLTAEAESDGVVGRVWVGLEHERRSGAWIYDIEIDDAHRGKGYGRALLSAVEELVLRHGSDAIGLNVFADNEIARALYDSSGYQASSLHMRKPLR